MVCFPWLTVVFLGFLSYFPCPFFASQMFANVGPSDTIRLHQLPRPSAIQRCRAQTQIHAQTCTVWRWHVPKCRDSTLVISVTAGAAVACKCGRMWVSQCCFLMEFTVFSSLGDEVPDADWNVFDEACKVPCLQIWSASLALICGSVFCISMRFVPFCNCLWVRAVYLPLVLLSPSSRPPLAPPSFCRPLSLLPLAPLTPPIASSRLSPILLAFGSLLIPSKPSYGSMIVPPKTKLKGRMPPQSSLYGIFPLSPAPFRFLSPTWVLGGSKIWIEKKGDRKWSGRPISEEDGFKLPHSLRLAAVQIRNTVKHFRQTPLAQADWKCTTFYSILFESFQVSSVEVWKLGP